MTDHADRYLVEAIKRREALLYCRTCGTRLDADLFCFFCGRMNPPSNRGSALVSGESAPTPRKEQG